MIAGTHSGGGAPLKFDIAPAKAHPPTDPRAAPMLYRYVPLSAVLDQRIAVDDAGRAGDVGQGDGRQEREEEGEGPHGRSLAARSVGVSREQARDFRVTEGARAAP